MSRYRIMIDVVDDDSGEPTRLTTGILNEIRNAAIAAGKLELPPGTTNIKVVPTTTSWHVHTGDSGRCTGCREASGDGAGQDVSMHFTPKLMA